MQEWRGWCQGVGVKTGSVSIEDRLTYTQRAWYDNIKAILGACEMDTTPDYNELVAAALEVLLQEEVITHDVSIGIAKKIIGDGGLGKLSDNQMRVFNNYIEPLLHIKCENEDCKDEIDLADIPEAYAQQFDLGGLFCEECLYIEARIAREVEKDD